MSNRIFVADLLHVLAYVEWMWGRLWQNSAVSLGEGSMSSNGFGRLLYYNVYFSVRSTYVLPSQVK
jgi:hypothetical protein